MQVTDGQFSLLLEKIDNLQRRGDERFDWLKEQLSEQSDLVSRVSKLEVKNESNITFKHLWIAVGSVLTFGVVILGLYHSLFAM